MTEEEKNNLVEKEIIKRIDYILDKANYLDFEGKKEYISFKKEYLQDLFDLCKKQQKELEELRENKNTICVARRQYGKTYGITKEYISKDKIKDYYHKICASVNHFESKNDNNIVLRIKRYLEELLGE